MATWITAIGVLSAALTTVAFLPQAIKTIKTKKTEDLSFGMLSIQAAGNFGWSFYGFLIWDMPVLVANILTFALVFVIWLIKVRNLSKKK